MKKFILLFVVLIISTKFLFSLSDSTETAMKIDSVTYNKVTNIEIGDTLQMTIHYHTLIQDTCTAYVNFDNSFQFIDSLTNSYSIQYVFVSDTVGTISFSFISIDTSAAQMNLIIKMRNTCPGYSDIAPYNVNFKFDSSNKMEIQSINDVDDELTVFNYSQTSCQNTPNRHITINGKVLFQDWLGASMQMETYETYEDKVNFPKAKSPYADVWLFFRKSNTVNITHPILDNPLPIEHVHYAKCDEDGNFSFDVNFNIGDIDCSTNGYYDILLFIAKENVAIRLTSPSDHIRINNIKNIYQQSQTGNFFNVCKVYYNMDPNLTEINIPTANFGNNPNILIPTEEEYTWEQIAIPYYDGAALRHLKLCKDFTHEIADVVLPQVETKIKNVFYADGEYDDENYIITVRTPYCNNQALSHEYGHYFDHLSTSFQHESHSPQYYTITEAFAMFFSYAFRIWERNIYSDLIVPLDNLEISPFCYQYKITGQTTSDIKGRFGNTTKNYSSERFACYLWNIYDSKNDGDFSPLYNFINKNNDDVDGLGADLFAFWMDDDDAQGSLEFHNAFKAQYSTDLQNSIYDFMQYWPNDWPTRNEFDNTAPIPLDEHEHWMKSPNLDEFSYGIMCPQLLPCYLDISWENTNSYDYYGTSVRKEWIYYNEKDDYYWHFEYELYPNIEKSVKIYYKVNDTWQLQQEISPISYPDNYIISFPELSGIDYVKASTNNEFADDSYLPIIWYRYQKRGVVENTDELFSYKVINNNLFANCTSNTSALLISFYDINGKLLCNNIYQIEGKQTFELDLKSILNVTHQFTILSINVINTDGNVNNYYEKIIW